MTGIDAATGLVANPFVGPRPIERGQPIFGRDAEIDQLYYLLSAERIVLFHSPSGAGKSSLLQAGLIPRLVQQFDVWAPVRVNLQVDGATAVNRYVRSCNLGFEAEIPRERQRQEHAIAAMSLVEYVTERPRRRSAPRNVVLIFDQFEEVLTVDPLALDAKREFFGQLSKLLQDPKIWAIFSIREDYLGQLDPYAEMLPTHLKNRYRLDLLSRSAAGEAIERLAELGGRGFAPEPLAKLVVDMAMMRVQQPGGDFQNELGPNVEPLHLQVVCRNLWERMAPERTVIENSDIETFGNVNDALGEYFDTEVQKAASGNDRTERKIRDWCGKRLITRGKIRAQVLREAGQSGDLDNRLIERLIDAHLVRGEQRGGATWYELSHDRLAEPVLAANESWLEVHLSLFQQRALRWEREGEPESLVPSDRGVYASDRNYMALHDEDLTKGERRFLAAWRKKRRRQIQLRFAAVVLVAFLMVTFALSIVTSALWLRARRERDRAEMNLQLAKRAVDESLSSAGRQQARESADSPEMELFRRDLLDKAAAFYAVFTHEDFGNLQLRTEAAWAHSRLGDVNRLLEHRDDAMKEYKQAIASFQALAAEHPDKSEYRQALAYCHNWLGEIIRMSLEQAAAPDPTMRAEAKNEYDEALRLQQEIHDRKPEDTDATQELARSYYNRGILFYDEGDRQGAEFGFRTAMGLLEGIENGSATKNGKRSSPKPIQELARVYNNLATLQEREGKSGEARAMYERAIQKAEQLDTRSAQRREYQAELAQYCDNEARLLFDMNDVADAARRSDEALNIVEVLANPAPALSQEQAKIVQLRSEILLAQGSPEALDAFERERYLLDRLVRSEAFEHSPLFQKLYADLAVNYVELARKELAEGNSESAQLSLKNLVRVIPQLTPDDRAAAQNSYKSLQDKVRTKLSSHN
jgi:tetratricopeptide (TPR) repeat protein